MTIINVLNEAFGGSMQRKELSNKECISWDNCFMGIALLLRLRSRDTNTKVGACLVNDRNEIISIGYNDFPLPETGIEFSWKRDGQYLQTKYPYVCHAELNTLISAKGDTRNSKMYITSFPCSECAKAIIQAGVQRVIYSGDDCSNSNSSVAALELFKKYDIVINKIDCIEVKTQEFEG